MSGDQLDLDAIAAWFEGKTEHSSLDDLSVVSEWHAVRDLIAEVRRLRAQVARSDQWLAAANAVIRERALDEIECCASGSCEVCRR